MTKYSLENQFWKLDIIDNDKLEFEYILHDKVNNINFSEGDYHYRALTFKERISVCLLTSYWI